MAGSYLRIHSLAASHLDEKEKKPSAWEPASAVDGWSLSLLQIEVNS